MACGTSSGWRAAPRPGGPLPVSSARCATPFFACPTWPKGSARSPRRRWRTAVRRPRWPMRWTSSICSPISPPSSGAALEDRPPAALGDGGVIRARLRPRARRAALAPRRRPPVHRLAPAAGARAHRHRLAQGRLQQGVRLLHRDHQRARGQGSRRLRAPADPGVRRALRDAGAQGVRGAGPRRRGADGRARAELFGALRGVGGAGRSRGCSEPPACLRGSTCGRRSPSGP